MRVFSISENLVDNAVPFQVLAKTVSAAPTSLESLSAMTLVCLFFQVNGVTGTNNGEQRPYPITISWGTLADYAEAILNYCTYRWQGVPLVTGQLFDSDGWNVVVRGAAC